MRQREYFRLDLTVFCSLRLRKLGSKMLPLGETFEAEVQNISGGGLCFLSDRELPTTEMLVWQILIDFPHEPINVYGHIIWKKEEEDMFLYGVKLIFFEESNQRKLLSKINEIQIRQRQRQNFAFSQ